MLSVTISTVHFTVIVINKFIVNPGVVPRGRGVAPRRSNLDLEGLT